MMEVCPSQKKKMPLYEDNLHEKDIKYLSNAIPNASRYKLLIGLSIFKTEKDFFKDENYKIFAKYLNEAHKIDPSDLNTYHRVFGNTVSSSRLEGKISFQIREYCKKAVEQKQWDHIFYLTEVRSPEDIIQCLDEKNEYHYLCECPEAMKLAVKGWSKKALYDPIFFNPDAEEVIAEYEDKLEKELRNAILKTTDRDLNKEPKVYYYKGDPGI